VRRLVGLALVALLAAAGAWLRIRGGALGLATGMLFLSTAWLAGMLAVELAMTLLGTPARTRTDGRLVAVALGVSVLALEVGLRLATVRYATYAEQNGRPYWSSYTPRVPGWFHVYRPGPHRYAKPEYTHTRQISALGLTQELPGEKTAGEYRILALGDSFTEGVGAPEESTFVRVVERRLSARHTPWRIISLNAGVAGSDPFYAYVLFREKLLPFQADLVILAINTSDVAEIMVRGGMERFRPDGSVAYRDPPPWEWLYAVSYLTRAVVRDALHFDPQLQSPAERQRREQPALDHLQNAIESTAALCRSHGAHLLVVAHPMEAEVRNGTYDDNFDRLLTKLSNDPRFAFLDLFERYRQIPITPTNITDYFWHLDRHHNTRGYETMGNLIASEITRRALGPPASRPDRQ
jgi:hypothetical protein